MLNLCSSRHEEICFEGRKCPLCERTEEKDQAIAKKDDEISGLQGTIDDLQNQLAEMPST